MLTHIWHSKEKLSSSYALSSANGMILPAMNFILCSQRGFASQQQKEELQLFLMETNKTL